MDRLRRSAAGVHASRVSDHQARADWDAATYDRIADPQERWARRVLGRLALHGDETVLDAGCGSGRVTALLVERLPRGQVVALDASPAMLAAARQRLATVTPDRVRFVEADLSRPLPLAAGSLDVVFSNATFHWVLDQEALFRGLAAVLRPGGRLIAQCGGAGNIASVIEAAEVEAAHVAPPAPRGPQPAAPSAASFGAPRPDDDPAYVWARPWVFATPQEARRRLRAAGFVEIRAWLEPEPTRLEAGPPLETFLRTVVLRPYLARMPDAAHEGFVHGVARRLPAPLLDYVRLNITASRAG
jgi:trans-aconitate 2-methyltransferase